MNKTQDNKAIFHLPGLFEFYELYKVFLPLFFEKREYFYDWCQIGSIYGSPADCLWGGGRVGYGDADPEEVLDLMMEYGISARLTFSNSRLRLEHLADRKCNRLCKLFSKNSDVKNGVIIYSDLLLDYIRDKYPDFYFVSSTTKVIKEYDRLIEEINRDDYSFVVPDFRFNTEYNRLATLNQVQKDKIEFLCNECCSFGCKEREVCYENVSRKNLGEACPDHVCPSSVDGRGYRFSKAMENQGFIGIEDIEKVFIPRGFKNFKIEGRSLGSAMILEIFLYYMVKPQYQIAVREEIYLDSMLDLF